MPALTIVYDGECIYCRRYVALLRLRHAVGEVKLVDARQGGAEVEEVARAGILLDEGMALKYADRWYHGADAMHMASMLSSRSDWANRVLAWVFGSRSRARILYPALRWGRNMTLALRGKPQIAAPR